MAGKILMGKKELERSHVIKLVESGAMRLVEAANQLGISYRQAKRIRARYCLDGEAGLLHKNQGRKSNNRKSEETKARVIRAYEERYYDFGPTFAVEKLAENEGIIVSRETLRQWLIENGFWKRKRRRNPYRSRRERRECFGELVQFDGSHHDWFLGRRGKCCLMNLVDDATGLSYAQLFEQETTEAAMRVLWEWIESYGIPQSLYCDKKNAFVLNREPTVEEQLAGIEPKSHLERACERLGVQIITAHSPQAKGRVERNHGVYQDRFVKELRLRDISSIEEANKYLREEYLPKINAKFARTPVCAQNGHVPHGKTALREILCFEEQRTVSHDFVVSFKKRLFQILPKSHPRPRPGEKVTVRVRLDGTSDLYHKGEKLSYTEIQIKSKKEEVRPFVPATGGHFNFAESGDILTLR